MGKTYTPEIVRFQRKCAQPDENGCVIWLGASSRGYGYFGKMPAHRWIYQHHHGVIPKGLEIDHRCRNRGCVEASHLEAVTREENVRRYKYSKSHCPKGHEYTPENSLLRGAMGHRICRTCYLERGIAFSRSCPQCSREYETRDKRQKYCSHTCALKARHAKTALGL